MSGSFELLPAIDLQDGRVVRLTRGDFARQTVYGSDPVDVAVTLAAKGARWLHVVDLDGARAGHPRQAAIVATIVAAVGTAVRCQVAGGLRSVDAVAAMLDAGAARVVVGTALLHDPSFGGRLVARFGRDRIVAALDVRDGSAVGDAWLPDAVGEPVDDQLARLASTGIERFAVTAIERDGELTGPDLELIRRLAGLGRGAILASGGIRDQHDLDAAREAGASGAIVGKALYEGRLDLRAAIQAMAGKDR